MSRDPRAAWNDYSAELADIRGDDYDPDTPTRAELAGESVTGVPLPWDGVVPDHAYPGWEGCECGRPASVHPSRAEVEGC